MIPGMTDDEDYKRLQKHIDRQRLIAQEQTEEIDLQFHCNNWIKQEREKIGAIIERESALGQYIIFLERELVKSHLDLFRKNREYNKAYNRANAAETKYEEQKRQNQELVERQNLLLDSPTVLAIEASKVDDAASENNNAELIIANNTDVICPFIMSENDNIELADDLLI